MSLLFVVNSFIGKTGNVGFRIGKIIEYLPSDVNAYTISRGCLCKVNIKKAYTPSVLGHLPRIVKAAQMYIYKGINYRYIDMKMFEFYFLLVFYLFLRKERHNNKSKKVAHLVEPSPLIIKHLKKYNYTVILDLAIAPSSYVNSLKKEEKCTGFYYDSKIDNMERIAVNLADVITVPSEFVFEEVKKLLPLYGYEGKVIIQPFGVDDEGDINRIDNIDYNKKGIDFCFAGIINHRKGINYLLDAWKDDVFSDDRLHLCGRVTPEISKLLNENKFDNIILPGFINTKRYFQKCDIYVFPSLLEGSSKSTYEAMASGLPVITTFESGSIIKDGVDGIIVPKASVEELKLAMLLLKNSCDMRKEIRLKAFDKIKKFTWSYYSERYIELYKEFML